MLQASSMAFSILLIWFRLRNVIERENNRFHSYHILTESIFNCSRFVASYNLIPFCMYVKIRTENVFFFNLKSFQLVYGDIIFSIQSKLQNQMIALCNLLKWISKSIALYVFEYFLYFLLFKRANPSHSLWLERWDHENVGVK